MDFLCVQFHFTIYQSFFIKKIITNSMNNFNIQSISQKRNPKRDSLAPEVGLEPTTLRLTAACSAS